MPISLSSGKNKSLAQFFSNISRVSISDHIKHVHKLETTVLQIFVK